MLVPSSLTPPKLPNGDEPGAVVVMGDSGLERVGVVAPGEAVCGIPPLMSSAATLSERVCLVGDGVSAMVTCTTGTDISAATGGINGRGRGICKWDKGVEVERGSE